MYPLRVLSYVLRYIIWIIIHLIMNKKKSRYLPNLGERSSAHLIQSRSLERVEELEKDRMGWTKD
jgi:hypothetical protein